MDRTAPCPAAGGTLPAVAGCGADGGGAAIVAVFDNASFGPGAAAAAVDPCCVVDAGAFRPVARLLEVVGTPF